MKKTFFAMAVALFCATAPTSVQAQGRGHNKGPRYDNRAQNNRSYGNDRDPWHDGRQAYDRRQYNRRWVAVQPARRNFRGTGHWVYVPKQNRRSRYAPAKACAPRRYGRAAGYATRGRW